MSEVDSYRLNCCFHSHTACLHLIQYTDRYHHCNCICKFCIWTVTRKGWKERVGFSSVFFSGPPDGLSSHLSYWTTIFIHYSYIKGPPILISSFSLLYLSSNTTNYIYTTHTHSPPLSVTEIWIIIITNLFLLFY